MSEQNFHYFLTNSLPHLLFLLTRLAIVGRFFMGTKHSNLYSYLMGFYMRFLRWISNLKTPVHCFQICKYLSIMHIFFPWIDAVIYTLVRHASYFFSWNRLYFALNYIDVHLVAWSSSFMLFDSTHPPLLITNLYCFLSPLNLSSPWFIHRAVNLKAPRC